MLKSRRNMLKLGGVSAMAFCAGTDATGRTAEDRYALSQNNVKVCDFGAVADGKTVNTKAVQAAIDAVYGKGGGMVAVEAGTYLCGSVVLKDNVYLYLAPGAILKATDRFEDYDHTGIVNARDAVNVGITGFGTIDGNGEVLGKIRSREGRALSRTVEFVNCKNVLIADITLQNTYRWVQHYINCENLNIDGITVHSKVNICNDGIDVDSCDKVRISNCEINSGDDCIVLKSAKGNPCRNVTVTNCVLSSNCTALKTGTDSYGGFENIVFTNCTIYDNRSGAIALNLVDGGVSNNISVSNIVISNARTALSIRLGSRNKVWTEGLPQRSTGAMHNIQISNIQATGIWGFPISICGVKEAAIENITLDNIRMVVAGGGFEDRRKMATVLVDAFERAGDTNNAAMYRQMLSGGDPQRKSDAFPIIPVEGGANDVPEVSEAYPDDKMFGPLPAYGVYCRHIKNLSIHRLDVRFEKDDRRPAVICENVEDIEMASIRAKGHRSAACSIRFNDVRGAMVTGCRADKAVDTFLAVARSRDITVTNNDFSKVARPVSAKEKSDCFVAHNRIK